MRKTVILIFIFIFYFYFSPKIFSPVLAVKYSLVAPTGPLTRGQTVRFTINIDTQGATIQTGTIGMTYDTQYLQYQGTTAGSAMTTVSTSTADTGKLVFSGENTAGFSGQGIFAYVDFKLIAQAAGSTELCVLWAPSTTPTPIPTNPPGTTATPTTPLQVTNLPTSGVTNKGMMATSLGITFLSLFGIFYYLDKKISFKHPKKK
jgi:hypothetical protein